MEETNQTNEPTPVVESVPTDTTGTAQEELPSIGAGSMIGLVFTDPFRLGKYMVAKPVWLLPFIIAAVFSATFTLVGQKQLLAMTERRMEQSFSQKNVQLPADKQKEIIDMSVRVTKYTAPIFAALASLIFAAAAALVLLFVCNLLMGGTAKYAHLFAGMMWVQLISSAGVVVKLPMVLIRDTFDVPIGPAVMMPEGSQGFLFTLLSGLDLFIVWEMIAAGIVTAAIYKWSKGKGITVVMTLYLIVLLCTAGLASMGGSMGVQVH